MWHSVGAHYACHIKSNLNYLTIIFLINYSKLVKISNSKSVHSKYAIYALNKHTYTSLYA